MRTRVMLRWNPANLGGSLRSVGQWLAHQFVQTVPEELSVCEYECDEPECHIRKWSLCTKRPRRSYEIGFEPD